MELKNRVVSAPIATNTSTKDGLPTADTLDINEKLAESGVAAHGIPVVEISVPRGQHQTVGHVRVIPRGHEGAYAPAEVALAVRAIVVAEVEGVGASIYERPERILLAMAYTEPLAVFINFHGLLVGIRTRHVEFIEVLAEGDTAAVRALELRYQLKPRFCLPELK